MPKTAVTSIKLLDHKPMFVEFCEGCGKTKECVKDIEVQSHTGRQILRTFLCLPCRVDLGRLVSESTGLETYAAHVKRSEG